jgi:hypothetical protein
MFVNETYSTVHISRNLSEKFFYLEWPETRREIYVYVNIMLSEGRTKA